jgi:hypothetical protein
MAGATLEAAGSGVSGSQVKGVTAQYQIDGTDGVAELGANSINPAGGPSGVHPYDSGTILGNIPPGKTGQKLVNGTVQRSNVLITTGPNNNCLQSTYAVNGGIPTPPVGSQASDGLSGAQERE